MPLDHLRRRETGAVRRHRRDRARVACRSTREQYVIFTVPALAFAAALLLMTVSPDNASIPPLIESLISRVYIVCFQEVCKCLGVFRIFFYN